jgi:hypothetical protein
MDIDPYLLAVALAVFLVAALAWAGRLLISALRPRREPPTAARRNAPIANDYYVRTLQQAAEVVGGEANLATALDVPPEALRRWLSGEEPPPIQFHLAALDLVTRRSGRPPKRRNARTP